MTCKINAGVLDDVEAVEASDLGLPPGEFPKSMIVTVTNNGGPTRFIRDWYVHDSEGEVTEVLYHDATRENHYLRLFND